VRITEFEKFASLEHNFEDFLKTAPNVVLQSRY